MKANEQTLQQVERALRKVADKFPLMEEASQLTDIDDDDKEITRCVVEQWIDNKDDTFYSDVATVLRNALNKQKKQIEEMSILKPYSFVLEDEDHENVEELYLVDDDIVIIDEELMKDLDSDLDNFLNNLLKD